MIRSWGRSFLYDKSQENAKYGFHLLPDLFLFDLHEQCSFFAFIS